MRKLLTLLLGTALLSSTAAPAPSQTKGTRPERWSKEKANAWYGQLPWLVGCNFIPSTAINQLEMWQADTFDPKTIDRELGWAAGLGFTSVRVFLHDLLWQQDRDGLLRRMEQFLAIADVFDQRFILRLRGVPIHAMHFWIVEAIFHGAPGVAKHLGPFGRAIDLHAHIESDAATWSFTTARCAPARGRCCCRARTERH